MRAVVVALALLVGFTSADARDLVQLREPAQAAAKPAPKKSSARAKKKPQPVRKSVAKSKAKPKVKKKHVESEEVRLRPMP